MTISQRGAVDGVVVDVVCTGRFYDFFEKRAGEWAIVRRQPIYEKDRMDPVDPSARIKLEPDLLGSIPEGYRHLGYLQSKLGFTVERDLPQLKGEVVARLYRHGRAWLDGAPSAFPGGVRRESRIPRDNIGSVFRTVLCAGKCPNMPSRWRTRPARRRHKRRRGEAVLARLLRAQGVDAATRARGDARIDDDPEYWADQTMPRLLDAVAT